MGKRYAQKLLVIIFLMYMNVYTYGQSVGDFQSFASGSWNTLANWSRWDGTTWVNPAPTYPISTDGAITILNGHNINKDVGPTISIDQVVVKSGGTLTWTSSTFNVANGPGDDIVVESGGTFLQIVSTPLGGAFPATVRIKSGAVFEGRSNMHIDYPTDATGKWIWEDGSMFTYNAGSGSLNIYGYVYFPNATTAEIPIFRVANFSSINSSTDSCVINGVFEYINTIKYFNPNPTGTIIFRNGIRGAGNIKHNASTTGKFIISGNPAELGGSGNISLQPSGLEIRLGANVTLTSNKIINTEALATNALTVNGTLSCGTNNITGTASFILSAAATLKMGSANGITILPTTSGNIQNTGAARSFSKGANYVYDGAAPQVSGAGIPDSVRSLTINNASGLTLSNATLTDTALLVLANGRIKTNSTHTLKLASTASVSSTSNIYGDINEGYQNSFVSGPLIVERNSSSLFTAPVGKDTSTGVYFAPVKLTPANGTVKTYTVEYFPSIPPNQGIVDAPIDHVSFVEYWEIVCSTGASPDNDAKVGLSWRPQSGIGNGNPLDSVQAKADLAVAHYFNDGFSTKWHLEGITPTFTIRPGSSINYGYITSNLYAGSFSPFTLAAKSNLDLLPVKLISFTGRKTDQKEITLQWNTKYEQGIMVYEVERSTDGTNFAAISFVTAKNTSDNQYSLIDRNPVAGYNYYRLKIKDSRQQHYYSSTIKIKLDELSITVYPNPAVEKITVQHGAAVTGSNIIVYDMAGKKIISTQAAVGAKQTSVNTVLLAKGLYLLQFNNDSTSLKQIFIKQ